MHYGRINVTEIRICNSTLNTKLDKKKTQKTKSGQHFDEKHLSKCNYYNQVK